MNPSSRPNNPGHLSNRLSRRSLLRGAAVGAAGAGALVAFGAGSIARAAAPPITITKVEAANGSTLFVERVAGRNADEPNLWRPTGHVFVRNDSGAPVDVTSITIIYEGGSPPSLWAATPKTISAGATRAIPIPESRLLPYGLPETMTLEVKCQGFSDPVAATFSLAHMAHHTTDGTLPFPMKSSETASGVFLANGTNHGYGSNHGNDRQQRFAYDFHARRWTDNGWSKVKEGTDGSLPEDYLIWGQPVYAVANAKIVAAWRNRPDDAIDVDTSPGGNGFWMQLTGGDGETATFALYAHLMQGSIPEELVPTEGGPGPYVTKGQFLGLVGKSGTSKPHLHFHIQRGISDYVSNPASVGEGLPIRFTEMDVIGFEHFLYNHPGFGWKHATASGIGEECLVEAEAPEWVGPIQTVGMALPHPTLTSGYEPNFELAQIDPGGSLRSR